MDIDITAFVANEDPSAYSASIAERGPNAGPLTWAAAKERAKTPPPFLADADAVERFRDYMQGFGAWEEEEIAAWSLEECEALLIQMIAGDMREGGISSDMSESDWSVYERLAERGTVSSRISRGTDGKIYYYIGD